MRGITTIILLAFAVTFAAGCSPASEGQADAHRSSAGHSRDQVATTYGRDAASNVRTSSKESAPRQAAVLPTEPEVEQHSSPPKDEVAAAQPIEHGPMAVASDLPPDDGAAQPKAFPDEVTHFMVHRDGCDHFRGEEPYDAERRAYLEESVAELCTGTDAKLAQLRQRYADDPDVVTALSGYEDRIEGDGFY